MALSILKLCHRQVSLEGKNKSAIQVRPAGQINLRQLPRIRQVKVGKFARENGYRRLFMAKEPLKC